MKSDKMLDVICDEIDKIADKGLTSSNIENAYKLIDMYKDLKTVIAMEESDYSYAGDDGMSMRGRGNSYARRGEHYVRGHYSRDGHESDMSMDRYRNAKNSYRYSRSSGDKQMVMDALEDYMAEMSDKLDSMYRDADTQEERDVIQRYMNKMKNMK